MDSLAPAGAGRSLRFEGQRGEVVARSLPEVAPALLEVQRAVERGLHAAGFVAYEAAPALDPGLATRAPRAELPLLWFGLFDHRVERPAEREQPGPDAWLGPLRPSVTPAEYGAAVRRILQWIGAGDTYQVNHTFRLHGRLRGSEDALYRRLCAAQRAAYCAHLKLPGFSILSASPELFFHWQGDRLEMRPMKGTRRRGRWTEEDEARAAELLSSDKERAENLMIVDLLRNDAGRIARFGTVEVPRLFEVERYPTVHQLTSTVRARTREGVTLLDLFRALFPCGSVTGAPKVRTSQIIAELEDSPRGVYTGAIGYVSPGEAVFSVAIRTLLLDHTRGEVELGVGSGITSDSDPEAELRECLGKAAFVHHAPEPFELLESLRWEPDAGLLRLDGHLARLAGSARRFDFALDLERVREELLRFAGALHGGVHKLRLRVARDGGVAVEAEPIPDRSPRVRVAVAAEPMDSDDPMLYHKTTRREMYRARATSRPDCDDVLLVNRRGELTEATTANLVVQLDGVRFTPPLHCGLLPGVFRAELLRDGSVRERVLRPEDLAGAEALYLINSVRGWRDAELVP